MPDSETVWVMRAQQADEAIPTEAALDQPLPHPSCSCLPVKSVSLKEALQTCDMVTKEDGRLMLSKTSWRLALRSKSPAKFDVATPVPRAGDASQRAHFTLPSAGRVRARCLREGLDVRPNCHKVQTDPSAGQGSVCQEDASKLGGKSHSKRKWKVHSTGRLDCAPARQTPHEKLCMPLLQVCRQNLTTSLTKIATCCCLSRRPSNCRSS